MNLLHPLFLAGAAAVAVPIVLHLIRRRTRDRVTFSSLMFLRPTAPRFKHRSRLEHVPLLVLRCIALCLLAAVFARPFLSRLSIVDETGTGNRIVLLIDTSASMRREGVWARAIDEAQSVLASVDGADRLCVMSFDQAPRALVEFESWEAMDPAQRAGIVARELSELSPTWASTNLALALVAAAEAIEDDDVNDAFRTAGSRQVILVSDLQQGSSLEALLAYEWPKQIELVVKAIRGRGLSNASMQWIVQEDPLALSRGDELPKVRVTNSAEADKDRFRLHWDDGRPLDVYVAAGHSVVVRCPDPVATRVTLAGDDHEFDNVLYLAPQSTPQINILYIGNDDPNDTTEMLYYVRRAFEAGSASTRRVVARSAGESLQPGDIEAAHAVIVTDSPGVENSALLRRHIESGGALLLVLQSAESAAALSALAGIENPRVHEAEVDRYAMLGRIEFDHPLLRPFSDPRFADFTRIHFWKYRRLNVKDFPGARVLTSFDSGDPAWLEIPVGKGSLLVWTSGWCPSDSDLALSSKFVPLLCGVLERGGALTRQPSQYFVGDSVPVSQWAASGAADVQIHRPDGSIARVDAGRQSFSQTQLPGIYAVEPTGMDRRFAVNLPPGESRTDPMPVEDLERLGVSLDSASGQRMKPAGAVSKPAVIDPQSRLELWRWVLAVTLAVLLVETWLGRRLARLRPAAEEEQT